MPGTIVPPGHGDLLEFPEWQVLIKLSAADTAGTMSVLETTHDPGDGASAHIHTLENEMFFVLDGEVTFQVGNERTTLERGSYVFGPAGTAHGFEVGPGGGRLLHVFVPSGTGRSTVEDYFRELHSADPGVSFVDLRERHGMETIPDEAVLHQNR
jgi:quercetin dioxygenase-like cupin family protein